MAFDLKTAQPVAAPASMARGFDLASAVPVAEEQASGENPLWHKAKLFASDLVKGPLALPAAVIDSLNRAGPGGPGVPEDAQHQLAPAAFSAGLQGSMTQPQTPGEKWQSALTQSGAGALISPAGVAAPLRALAGGVGAGAGAETAASLLGEGPLQRLLGGALGGIGGAATASRIGRAAPQIEELVKQSLKGISPDMLKRAQEFQALALQKGVNVDLAQALEATGAPANNLTTLRNVLANSQHGSQVQAFLTHQPDQLLALADTTVAGMPGKIRQGDVASNNLQQAATDRIQLAKDLRTKVWEDTLASTKQALEDSAKLTIQQAQAKLPGLEMNVAQARGKLLQLQEQLAKAKAGDAAAIAAANKRVEEARALVEKLATFTLPRGQATGNTGRFLNLPQRGQSISNDEITRAVQATRVQAETPPKVQPAPSLETTSTAQALQQAGEQHAAADLALQAGRGELDAARAGFRAVSRVPPEVGASVVQNLRSLADKFPNTAQGRAMLELSNKLRKADGTPMTDPAQINQVLKEAAAKLKSPDLATQGVDTGTAKWIGSQIQNTREAYGTAFEPLRAANAAYRAATETDINPLRQGLVGDFAGVRGARPDVAAKQEKLIALFDKGENPAATGRSNIYTLGKELGKVENGAESFADAFKTYLAGKVSKAMPAELPSNPATDAASIRKVYDGLFANRAQFEGLRQGAAVSAELMGLPPKDVVRGLENFAQITRALLSRVEPGGLSRKEVFTLSGKNYGSDALRVFGIAPLAGPARRIEDFFNRRTFEAFDQLLTTPEGAAKLAELGKAPIMSAKALTLYSTLGGTTPQVSAGANAPGINTQ